MQKPEQKMLLALAREAISTTLGIVSTEVLDRVTKSSSSLYQKRLGLFVTLKKKRGDGSTTLRGCIGNLIGHSPLLESVVTLSREAAFRDQRFPPLRLEELSDLIIEISVVSNPTKIASYDQIRIGVDGVILSKGYHRAVFLPQVAPEQGWDTETMLTQLCIKAGLAPLAWKEGGCEVEVFQAEVFSEEEV